LSKAVKNGHLGSLLTQKAFLIAEVLRSEVQPAQHMRMTKGTGERWNLTEHCPPAIS